MENAARSERTRQAVIQAALTIIARDGPGRLTLDAIARESGISKGGLTHQFQTKQAVLKALLENQIDHFEKVSRDYLAGPGSAQSQPELSAEIATISESAIRSNSVAFAIVGALAEEPSLLSMVREIDAGKVERFQAEAADPDLAILRWEAAMGLSLSALLGLCPLSGEERARLFERLLDNRQWDAFSKADR